MAALTAAESSAVRMAALTVLQACAFAVGAKFTAIVFAVLGNALGDFDLAIAIGMSTNLLSHDLIPPLWERGSSHATPRGKKVELYRTHRRTHSQWLSFLRRKFLPIWAR
jgi:hypothetical protein